jgi:diguanylate cyclase (GGDEF)-like protein
MVECKYYSFYALAKINDPELLYEAFQQQIAPGHAGKIEVEVYQYSDQRWNRLTRSGGSDPNISETILGILAQKFGVQDTGSWYYDKAVEGWFCSYKPLTSKHFVLLVKTIDPDKLIEEDYLQFLFHFYCHQLQMLQGTYRDALTGLYNRVMLDIDHFKSINEDKGHLFGDEVLLLLAQQMTESFRDNDLLFRYGGEEFAMVLMDITPEQARQTLERFREKIAGFDFPNVEGVTVSIGHTRFDKSLSIDELIGQANAALDYCKKTTRNAVHCYQDLVEQGLVPAVKASRSPSIENV